MTAKLHLVIQLAFLLTAHVFSQMEIDLLVPANSSEALKNKFIRTSRGTGNLESFVKIPASFPDVSNQDITSQNALKNVTDLKTFHDTSSIAKNEDGKMSTQYEALSSEKDEKITRSDEESNPEGAFTTNTDFTSEQFSTHDADTQITRRGKLNLFLSKASNSTESLKLNIRNKRNYHRD